MLSAGRILIFTTLAAVFFTASQAQAGFVSITASDALTPVSTAAPQSDEPTVPEKERGQWLAKPLSDAGMTPVPTGTSPVTLPSGNLAPTAKLSLLTPAGVLNLSPEPTLTLLVYDLDTPPPRS